MARQIKRLMDDIVAEHESKRKSEFDTLQSQINPHFLYNTLDIIVWMIENEKQSEADVYKRQAVYLLLYTGSMYEFCKNAQGKAIFYPVLFLSSERVFSGLSVIMLPSAKNNGLAATFSQASEKKLDKKILILLLALLAVAAFGIWGMQGIKIYGVCLVFQGALFAWYDKWSKKNFGGITGDLAGFFLQT